MASYPRGPRKQNTWTVREGDQFFQGTGKVYDTLKSIAAHLERLGIPYAVAGGLALFHHGYRRYTEDIDILITGEDLKLVHDKLQGKGYLPKFEGARNLRDTGTGVSIEFIVTGEFPGDGKVKPVAFPDPSTVAEEIDGVRYLNLPKLVELKLASGMTNPDRLRDTADVQQLIKALNLPGDFVNKLDPFVRDAYEALWRAENAPKRFVRRWRKEGPAPEAKTIQELAERMGSEELREMAKDGITLDVESLGGDYAYLVTADPQVAAKYDMHEESEFL